MGYERELYQRRLLDSVVRGVGRLAGQLAAVCLVAGFLFLLLAMVWVPMLVLALGAFFLGAVFVATSYAISGFELPEPDRSAETSWRRPPDAPT